MHKNAAYGTLVAVVILAMFAGVDSYVRSLGPRAKARAIKAVSERFDSDVTLDDLQLSLFPSPSVVGGPLTLRHRGWNNPQPLISISRFTAESSFFNLFLQRDKVKLLRLEGLKVHISHHDGSAATMPNNNDRSRLSIGVQKIIADGTQLEIEPKDPGKDPLRFDIRKLNLESVGASEPMHFEALLNNPKPPGLINTSGHFGPWQKEDPRATALSGDYEFKKADLAVFKGISGLLSSTGSFRGVLQSIQVKGQTDTPDFALKKGGLPVHLSASFQSTVNGMNGDTILENVDAHFLESEFLCKGEVVRDEDRKGKKVDLFAVTKQPARMEDILRLITGDKTPLMTGAVQFQSKIVIPPGQADVADKLQLDGQFTVKSVVFSSANLNEKIETLSDRARGITKAEEDKKPSAPVTSDLQGKFKLKDGTMSFATLSFSVPGAMIKLAGSYRLPSHEMDLAGLFRMQSTLSDTQSGVKHLLLKPLDPVFRKDGAGVQVPFRISGTQDNPTLSVSAFHHTFKVKQAR